MNDSPKDTDPIRYRGRFAPSPTGPLHAGSLVAALASFLDARQHNGHWQLRVDDIDPPRAVTGSVDAITEALVAHGLIWDGPILFQSRSSRHYDRALDQLMSSEWLFRCLCTRATLDGNGCCGQHCREQDISGETTHSLRVRIEPERLGDFSDRFLGEQPAPAMTAPNDFIVKRRDGLYAYQLAAAVDDAKPHFTHVVRGADLLQSTHRQRWLQRLLELESPCSWPARPALYGANLPCMGQTCLVWGRRPENGDRQRTPVHASRNAPRRLRGAIARARPRG